MYVVLEIADSDFKKLFRAPVYLTELHIKTLLYNLLVGVKYVHSAGILHRDLVSVCWKYAGVLADAFLCYWDIVVALSSRGCGNSIRGSSVHLSVSAPSRGECSVLQKPANCLVNQDCSVKVCDFGLARTMDFPEGHSSHNPVTQQEDDIVNVPHTKNLKRQLTGHVVTR